MELELGDHFRVPNSKKKIQKIKIWGIDTFGSVFKNIMKQGYLTKIYPYTTEGIGEDIIPQNVNFSIIDHFEKVNDKDAALYTRKLARRGNFCWEFLWSSN